MVLTKEQIEKEHKIAQLKKKIFEFKQMQQIHEETLKKLTGRTE